MRKSTPQQSHQSRTIAVIVFYLLHKIQDKFLGNFTTSVHTLYVIHDIAIALRFCITQMLTQIINNMLGINSLVFLAHIMRILFEECHSAERHSVVHQNLQEALILLFLHNHVAHFDAIIIRDMWNISEEFHNKLIPILLGYQLFQLLEVRSLVHQELTELSHPKKIYLLLMIKLINFQTIIIQFTRKPMLYFMNELNICFFHFVV